MQSESIFGQAHFESKAGNSQNTNLAITWTETSSHGMSSFMMRWLLALLPWEKTKLCSLITLMIPSLTEINFAKHLLKPSNIKKIKSRIFFNFYLEYKKGDISPHNVLMFFFNIPLIIINFFCNIFLNLN